MSEERRRNIEKWKKGMQCRRIRNEVNKTVAKANINYFSSELNSCAGDQKETCSVLCETLGRAKEHLFDEDIVEKRNLNVCKSIADIFNRYFSVTGSSFADTFVNNNEFKTFRTEDLNLGSYSFCKTCLSNLSC